MTFSPSREVTVKTPLGSSFATNGSEPVERARNLSQLERSCPLKSARHSDRAGAEVGSAAGVESAASAARASAEWKHVFMVVGFFSRLGMAKQGKQGRVARTTPKCFTRPINMVSPSAPVRLGIIGCGNVLGAYRAPIEQLRMRGAVALEIACGREAQRDAARAALAPQAFTTGA